MATQRVIPIHVDILPAQTINITMTINPTNFSASPGSCIIQGSGQQGINFTNGSGAPVAIRFVANPVNPNQKVFNDIANLPGTGVPSPVQMPQMNNGSANFNIVVGGISYGPFGIQVGTGPLQMLISMSGGKITCTPNPVAVPVYNNALQIGGSVAMFPDNPNNNYSIGWPNGDPFQPPIRTPDGQTHADTGTILPADFSYTVSTPSPKDGGNGGGTIKIKGTN